MAQNCLFLLNYSKNALQEYKGSKALFPLAATQKKAPFKSRKAQNCTERNNTLLGNERSRQRL